MNSTLSPDVLTRLALSMESLQPIGAQPAWVEIIGPLEQPDEVRWHPDLETMVGFVAPDRCHAITAVGYGWARHLQDLSPGGSAAIASGAAQRCRVVCLMTRSGEMAGYLRSGPGILIDEPPTVGRVPDLIRRCFGLPTPPPDETTDGILARMWLSNVVGAGQQAAGQHAAGQHAPGQHAAGQHSAARLTWPTVARLHPALQVATEAGLTVPLDDLVRVLRVASDTWTWSHLTRQLAGTGWLGELLPTGAAGWMDEGILSRWLLASVTRIDPLMKQVTPLMVPTAVRKLRVTLTRLGVLPERPSGQPGTGLISGP